MNGPMMRRNRKRSRTAFSPFTDCPCCAGPTEHGRAAEKRQWTREAAEEACVPVPKQGNGT